MFEESMSFWASMNSWFTPTVLVFVLLNVMIGTIAFASNSGTTQKPQDPQQPQHQQGLARSPSVLQRLKSINLHKYRSPEPHTTTFEKFPETTENTHYTFTHTHELEPPQFTRSPSLQRLKSMMSINFCIPRGNSYSTNQTQPITTTTSLHKTQESKSHPDQATELPQCQDEDFNENHETLEAPEEAESDQVEHSLDEVFRQLKPLHEHHVDRTTSDTKPASGEVAKKLPKKMKKSASSKSAFAHFQADDIVEARRPATVRERRVAKVTEGDEEVDSKADDFIKKFKQQLKLQRLDSIIGYKDMITRGSS